MRPRNRGPRGPRGFTLIEVLVTLLIMAVMAAVTAPAFLSQRAPRELDDAEGRLVALFRMARDSAIRTATPVTVVIDSVSGLVWFDVKTRPSQEVPAETYPYGADPGDGNIRLRTDGAFGGGSTLGLGARGPGVGLRPPANGESLELPAAVGMELFKTRSRFTFAPTGAVQGDSILLRGPQGEVRVITLDPWTGRVRAR